MQPNATSEVRIKLNHLIEYGFVLPSFLLSCHLLNSNTFNTVRTTAAIKNKTWKNWIMELLILRDEVKSFWVNVNRIFYSRFGLFVREDTFLKSCLLFKMYSIKKSFFLSDDVSSNDKVAL